MTNVVDCEFDELVGGMALEVVFEQVSDDPLVTLPRFGLRREAVVTLPEDTEWSFPYEATLHDVFPALHEAQKAWMSQIDSLRRPTARPTSSSAWCASSSCATTGDRATRSSRARSSDVGGSARGDLHPCPVSACCSPSRRSRTRSGFDIAPEVEDDDDE